MPTNESLSKISGAVTRTTAAIGVKTSVFVGSAKHKTHINTLKKEISTLEQELGAAVYELWCAGQTDSEKISAICNLIKEKHENIAEIEVAIEKLERQESEVLGGKKPEGNTAAVFICTKCGAAYDSKLNFCRKCGNKMADPTEG